MIQKQMTAPGKGAVGCLVGVATCGLPTDSSVTVLAQRLSESFGLPPSRAELTAALVLGVPRHD